MKIGAKAFVLNDLKGGEDHKEIWFEEVKFEIPSGNAMVSPV